jgi:hypothetical protein
VSQEREGTTIKMIYTLTWDLGPGIFELRAAFGVKGFDLTVLQYPKNRESVDSKLSHRPITILHPTVTEPIHAKISSQWQC